MPLPTGCEDAERFVRRPALDLAKKGIHLWPMHELMGQQVTCLVQG